MSTHKTSVTIPYPEFGTLVTELRAKANIPNQAQLAKLLKTTQQTVSRWEAGLSRPRVTQISTLAVALQADASMLLAAAGYAIQTAVVSFDSPFPVDTLSPESFERLTAHLVQSLYPEAIVNRAGGQGHAQGGIDVVGRLADGRRYSYQCKRVQEFGPQKVHDVVAKDSTHADRKFLLLTRTASPEARAAMEMHEGWELWDRDDISRKIRELPLDDQKRIVRIFFHNQELALLGTSPASPWETVEEFFAAFDRDEGLFNHTWEMVGRDSSLKQILEALQDEVVGAVLLSGSAGAGKTRILKAALDRYTETEPATKIRLVSPTMEITKASLDELGTAQQLLVVDDAHDRSDLQVLFDYAASNAERTRLLLVFRRYGSKHIKAQASGYSFTGNRAAEIDLPALSKTDSEKLALQVLARHSGTLGAAKDIARLTFDCPLATVIAAQLVAQGAIHPNFAINEEQFRMTLFGRFEKVIAGHLGERDDAPDVQKLLGFIALVQPIYLDDKDLLSSFERVDKVEVHDASRLMKLLIDAGVLFKRGTRYRLSPDVLGDFLVESRFEGPDGRSNGRAELYFDALPVAYLENMLLNIGRIDWRRAGGAPTESPLLDGIWGKLQPTQESADPHIRAVRAVAYYQPKRALEFVDRLIRREEYLDQLAEIARYAAYTLEHTLHALECLWELGRSDRIETSRDSDNPIRIITELAEPQPNKPLTFNALIVEFALKLAGQADGWREAHTPFDILDAVLNTDGHTTTSEGHSIRMTPFFVMPDRVQSLREKVVDFAIALLSDDDTRKAVRAAQTLANALRLSIGQLGAEVSPELRAIWDKEFAQTLRKVRSVLKAKNINPLVQVEIGRSVAWQAAFGSREVATLAKEVQRSFSSDLDFRIARVLNDGYGMQDRLGDRKGNQERWANFVQEVVVDLEIAYPNAQDRLAAIESKLQEIKNGGKARASTPEVLVVKLIEESEGFADAVIVDALNTNSHELSRFSGHALGKVLRENRDSGRSYIQKCIAEDRPDLHASIGIAFQFQNFDGGWFTANDIGVLEDVLHSKEEWVVLTAVRAIRRLAEWDQSTALALIRSVAIHSSRIADEIASLFVFGDVLNPKLLSEEDAKSLLLRLETLAKLDGHWLDKLLADLSEQYPWECAQFFMRRVEFAAEEREFGMRPCNYGPWANERLRFRHSRDGVSIMREVAQWMKLNCARKGMFNYFSRTLFEAMFGPFDTSIVHFLNELLSSAKEDDIRLVANIVREADPSFVFEQLDFVKAFLELARQYGPALHRMASTELYCSAIEGVRHGSPGQPFQQDINLKLDAQKILASIPRFSAAFELYENLTKYANAEIERSVQDHEEFEE
jgi:transcriptional regulator with XRE-family HTH domain